MSDAKAQEILSKYLNEGEKAIYDPKTGKIVALMESTNVARELTLPVDVQQAALKGFKKVLHG